MINDDDHDFSEKKKMRLALRKKKEARSFFLIPGDRCETLFFYYNNITYYIK